MTGLYRTVPVFRAPVYNVADYSPKMSRAVFLLTHRALHSHVPATKFYFTPNNQNLILDRKHRLKLKCAGLQEDTKRWGFLWSMVGDNVPRVDRCMEQKVVKVTAISGETVMAITFDNSSCSF